MNAEYDRRLRNRRSIRLAGYDYAAAGAYFLTICTHHSLCLLGDVADGEMRMNVFGRIVQACWEGLPRHYTNVKLDAFVVMPNHVHGIVILTDSDDTDVGAGLKPAPTTPVGKRHSLPEIIRALKTFSSRRINELRHTAGVPVWQRNYYEHVIRDEEEMGRIREYIIHNASRWAEDAENPGRIRGGIPHNP